MVRYELKKVLGSIGGRIALALLALLTGFICYKRIYDQWNVIWYPKGENEFIFGPMAAANIWNVEKEWTGVLDQDMLQRALQFLKETDDYEDKLGARSIRDLLNLSYKKNYQYQYSDFYIAETVEPEQLPQFYENRIKHLKQWLYNEDKTYSGRSNCYTEQQKQYILDRVESVETPIRVGYALGWRQAGIAVQNIGLFGTFILGYLLSGVFANERRWRADAVYFSTVHGRKQGIHAKIKAGFILTTVLYWGAVLITSLIILTVLGFEGWNCSILMDGMWWDNIYDLNYLQKHLCLLLTGYLGWLFVAALTMLISVFSSSGVFPVLAPVLLGYAPLFLSGRYDLMPKLLRLSPTVLFGPFTRVSELQLYTVFGKVVTNMPIAIVLYSSLTVLFVWLSYLAFSRKQIH